MPKAPPTDHQASLKLVAFDNQDLEIISAHCQDAIVRISDIAYIASERRFALIMNRFDWENAIEQNKISGKKQSFRRRRTALRFECVTKVQQRNIDLKKQKDVKELLTIRYQEQTRPQGHISLIFAGKSEIKLEVECIEAILQDLGAIWETNAKPTHPETEIPQKHHDN